MTDVEYFRILTVLVSAILGASLGFLAKSYFTRLTFRQSTIESIVNRYLDVRDELCSLIAECAVNADSQDENWLNDTGNEISLAYYKYFDYIPEEVIKELVCLQVCLKSRNNWLYKIESENLLRIEESELIGFCESIATFENTAIALHLGLYNGSKNEIRNRRIEFQARNVLVNINRYFTEENLTSLNLVQPKNQNKTTQRINR